MKSLSECRLSSLLSLSLFLTLPVSAQQVGSIVGELHVARGDFPGRVLIELQLHRAPIGSQYTDEQGKFAFSSLPNNLYRLVIHDERFYPVEEDVNLDLSITAIRTVQINLTPREKDASSEAQIHNATNPNLVDVEQYRRQFPKKALKEFDKGVEADGKGKPDDAIRHYQKAIDIASTFYPAHNNIGSDLLKKSDFANAQLHFKEAIKLNQSDAEAHLNLANLYLTEKHYDLAFESAQEGLRRDPNSAFGQFLLGAIHERLGKFAEAERALRSALSLSPLMSRAHLELVNLYLLQKDNIKAMAELRTFLDKFPADPLAPRAKEVLNKLEAR
jgi:tetratricopeptide (TPR) repeat protein